MSIVEVDPHECILWDGPLRKGYAIRNRNGKRESMARVIVAEETGKPIPPGMVVRHKCDNPACVAPDHLLLGTHADNAADKVRRKRHVLAGVGLINNVKTHCPQGHPYAEENVAFYKNGGRYCKTCIYARNNKYYAANRDRILSQQKAYRVRKQAEG